MRIIVIGAGEVGYHLAMRLSDERHDVVVIERDAELVDKVQAQLDVLVIEGNGASPDTLEKAGVAGADLLLAVTNIDEVNLIACLVAGQFEVAQKVARVSNPEYYERPGLQARGRFGADMLINPERECAREILKLLLRSEASDVAEFSEGRVVLLGLPVTAEAPVAQKTLADIGRLYKERHFLTVAIDRNGDSIIPDGDTRLLPGDEIYLVSEARHLKEAYRLLGLERRGIERVILLGGGRVGFALAEMLEAEGVDTTILERSRPRCLKLAERLQKTLVLQGDATDLDLLTQEGIGQTDGLAAVTSEDETNLLASLLAKHLGTRKVVTLMKRSEYIPLVTRVGVDAAVSPRLSTANRILKRIRGRRVLSMAIMERNQAEVMEVQVDESSRTVGKQVRDLGLPTGAILGSIQRGDEVVIPRGDTRIEPGDQIVVFALPRAVEETAEFFNR